MNIQCPYCGANVSVHGLGRKSLKISVKNVCDALRTNSTIKATAQSLGCSRGYIYRVIHNAGLTLEEIKK
jgi:transposase-like protein